MKRKLMALSGWVTLALFLLQGCAGSADVVVPQPSTNPSSAKETVAWPKNKLETAADGAPILKVYNVDKETVEALPIESYVEGVLAGEMKNDWPLEALKAQAILARTFVLKFVAEKESRYPGADISTDIEEAQAYNGKAVNARVRQAVAETRGMVLASEGELPYAWFHAHSGGMTERAIAGLGWDQAEPSYTKVTESGEPETAQTDEKSLKEAQSWEASFTAEAFAAACQKQGVKLKLTDQTKLAVGERGESGRAVTLKVGDQSVKATELRIALGSTKMRSTLLTSLQNDGGTVKMAGKGYGHGVGMSQWGAYAMAQQGEKAEAIIQRYFQNVTVARLWE